MTKDMNSPLTKETIQMANMYMKIYLTSHLTRKLQIQAMSTTAYLVE